MRIVFFHKTIYIQNKYGKHISNRSVEDEEHFRKFLSEKLEEFENIIIWKSAEECYRDNRLTNLDLLILDIGLPHMSGIDLIKLIKPKHPLLKVIVVSGINSDEIIFDALKYGANGYIWKNELDNLADNLKIVMNEGSFMSPFIAVRILHFFRSIVKEEKINILTEREKQVVNLIISGFSIIKIANLLGISSGTVRKHVNHIYAKLEVTNRVELMKKANSIGLLNLQNLNMQD